MTGLRAVAQAASALAVAMGSAASSTPAARPCGGWPPESAVNAWTRSPPTGPRSRCAPGTPGSPQSAQVFISGPVPYGYTRTGRRLVPDATPARVVEAIYQWRVEQVLGVAELSCGRRPTLPTSPTPARATRRSSSTASTATT
jgi:hypothetical protein